MPNRPPATPTSGLDSANPPAPAAVSGSAQPAAAAGSVDDEGWGDHSWAQNDHLVAHTTAGTQHRPRTPTGPDRQYRPAPRPADDRDASGPPSTPAATASTGSPSSPDRDAARAAALGGAPLGPGLGAGVALLVFAVVLAVGIVADRMFDTTAGLRIGLIVGSVAAVLLVRLVEIFPVLVAPPLAYVLGSAAELTVRSGGAPKRSEIVDFATNWLVYGFPTIAAATAIVVVAAVVRRRLNR